MTQASALRPGQSQSSTTLLLLSIGLGVVSVILLNLYIVQVRNQAAEVSLTFYKLNRSVQPGDRLQRKDLEEIKIPERFGDSMKGAIVPRDVENYINFPFMQPASQGDILWYALFTDPNKVARDSQITIGKRLISLPVNNKTMPAGLRPGVYVDISAPFSRGGPVPESTLIMERVKVFAVGHHMINPDGDTPTRPITGFRSITIEVLPEEAIQLSMISKLAIGDFDLQIRHPSERAGVLIPSGGINPDVLKLLKSRQRASG